MYIQLLYNEIAKLNNNKRSTKTTTTRINKMQLNATTTTKMRKKETKNYEKKPNEYFLEHV